MLVSELDLLLLLLLLVLLLRILVHFLDNHRLLCLFVVACLITAAGVICSSTGIGKLVASSSQLGMLRSAGDLLGFVPAMGSRGHVKLLLPWINLVVLDDHSDNLAHIILLVKALAQSTDSLQLCVCGIVVPADRGDGILRLE